MKKNLEIYRKKLLNATPDIQNIMSSDATTATIKRLVQKYNIDRTQPGQLAYEVGAVLLGMTPREDFVTHLQDNIGLSYEDSLEIAKEIDRDIFAHVKQFFQDFEQILPNKYNQVLIDAKQVLEKQKKEEAANMRKRKDWQRILTNPELRARRRDAVAKRRIKTKKDEILSLLEFAEDPTKTPKKEEES